MDIRVITCDRCGNQIPVAAQNAGPYPAADCASCQCSYTTEDGRLICVRKQVEICDVCERGLLPCPHCEEERK